MQGAQDLGQAKTYCLATLTKTLSPLIFAVLSNLFEVGKATVSTQSPWRTFQESLRDIPDWNQTLIREQTNRAEEECPHLERLVSTAMMCQASQLGNVRGVQLDERDVPRIKATRFIHDVYVRVAQELVHNPMLFGQKAVDLSIQNREKVMTIIAKCIEQIVDSYVPIEAIMAKPIRKQSTAHANRPLSQSSANSRRQVKLKKPHRSLGAYDSDTFDSAQDPSVIENDAGAEPMDGSSIDQTAVPMVIQVPTPSLVHGQAAIVPVPTAPVAPTAPEQSFIYAPSTLGKGLTYEQAKQFLGQVIV